MANENAQLAEFAENLWQNFIKVKIEEDSKDAVSFYRAEVVTNDGGNKLTIQRPYDEPYQVSCTDALKNVKTGDQVVVFVFGNGQSNSNHLVFTSAEGNTNCVTEEELEEVEEALISNSIAFTTTEYCLNSSNTDFEEGDKYGDWSEELPEFVEGYFYWMRTATHYVDGSVTYSEPYLDITAQIAAETKQIVDDWEMKDVSNVEIQYCLATANAIPPGQTFDDIQYTQWSSTAPAYQAGYYYWERTLTHFDDGTTAEGTPIFSLTAQTAAETEAALASTNNHFWYDNSGAYVTEQDGTYGSGYATRITASGIIQSRNGNTMSSWTNSGVSFYSSNTSSGSTLTTLAAFGTSGASLYDGSGHKVVGIDSTNGMRFYSADGNNRILAQYDSNGVELYGNNGTGGYKMKIVSSGIVQAYGEYVMSSWTNSGVAFYGQSGTSNPMLSAFSTTGVTLYQNNQTAAEFNSSGVSLYSGGTKVAEFGSSSIALGINSQSSQVSLCGGTGVINAGTSTSPVNNNYLTMAVQGAYSSSDPNTRGAQLNFVTNHTYGTSGTNTTFVSLNASRYTNTEQANYILASSQAIILMGLVYQDSGRTQRFIPQKNETTFTQPTAQSGTGYSFTYTSGGYYKEGKHVYVQIRGTATLPANSSITIAKTFPTPNPSGMRAALAITLDYKADGTIAWINNSGELKVRAGTAVSSVEIIITGVYADA